MNALQKIGCVVLLTLAAIAQTAQAQPQYVFRISFIDKTGSPSLASPLSFLSQRSLDRRAAQGLALDSTDRPVSPTYVNDVLTTTGGIYHVSSKWLNVLVILLYDSSKILLLNGKPYINDIKYTGYYSTALHKTNGGGNPPTQPKTTGSQNYYGDAWDQTNMVRGDYLHDRGFKGQGKLIAILDAGFLNVDTGPGFDSLVQSGRLVDKYNFVHASDNVYNYSAHGTRCLSIMAGYLPGIYVGTAPLAQYALYSTEIEGIDQPAEMDNMIAGMERADSLGADIISSSLGYNNFQAPIYSTLTYADIDGNTTGPARAVNMATTKGILCVISAGNEGGSGPWPYILTPGDADSAITVGSVDINKNPASNSGYGPNSAGRIKPDVCLMGQKAYVMQSNAVPFVDDGTSFATPQLAGWAACLWQATSNSTPYKLRMAISASADNYKTPGKQLGYGVPDFGKAFELLGIKDVTKVLSTDNWLNAYPNPFDKQLTVWLLMDQNADVSLIMTDVTGKKIYSTQQTVNKGTQVLQLNMPQMPAGIYYLKAVTGDKQTTTSLQKY